MQNCRSLFFSLAVLFGIGLCASVAQAQIRCNVNGRSVIQSEPCPAETSKTGKYRCFVGGQVVYQDESCIKPLPKPEKPIPAPVASSPSAASAPSYEDRTWIIQNQDLIRGKLKDPSSAEFSKVFVSRSSGGPVVCGMVNAKNSFGGYSGLQRFISAGSVVQVLASEMKSGEMDDLWSRVCR